MARRELVSMVDDLDGSTAGETVRFGLDGSSYEIDLPSDHARALREAMAPYVGCARRMTRTGRAYHRVRLAPDPKVVRAWAAGAGLDCPARGRIPQSVLDAFERADAG